MTMDLSQSWLVQVGRGANRDGLIVLGLMAIAAGAIMEAVTGIAAASAVPSLTFIGRTLTAIGGFFLSVPVIVASVSEERWSSGIRIAGLAVGFLIILFTLIRI